MNESTLKRRVLLVNCAVYLPGEGGYKRTMYMFDMMKNLGYKVTLLTSDFNHYSKTVRNLPSFYTKYPEYKDIILLHMPSYKKNISLKRLYAEKIWGMHFKKWFKLHACDYDVVLFSDIDYILSVDSICKKNRIKKIIDIRDLRPEAYRVVVKNELLYRLLFYGIKKKADKAFSCADELIGVSQEYLDRGLSANSKSKNPVVVYLGSSLERFYFGIEKYSNEFIKPEDEIWITYAGTLGESYDIVTIILAAKVIENRRGNKVKFKIIGQGPDKDKLMKLKNEICVNNVEFIPFMPYEKLAAFLHKSDITVNALKKTASQSIINKVSDYFAAGVPMLNGCPSKEQQEMVEKFEVGINYIPENADDLITKIEFCLDNPDYCEKIGENAKKLAFEKFDRRTSYKEILKRIDEV